MTAHPDAAPSGWTAPRMPGWAAGAFALLSGTMVRTAVGDRPAQSLRAGDEIQAADGTVVAVDVAERYMVEHAPEDCLRQPWPVRLRAGAIAEGLPTRDLVLLPWQPVALGGGDPDLAPPSAADLVNGASIRQESSPPLEWVCLRLPDPCVIVAEGVAMGRAPRAWSASNIALSTSARAWLGSGHVGFALAGGSRHDASQARLMARAAELGHKTSVDPDIRLVLSDRVLRPAIVGRVAHFALPDHTLEARLVSRSAVPSEIFDSGDTRRLGVPINAILADGIGVPLDHWSLRGGWQGAETGWRWTDGAARLLIPAGTRVLEFVIAFVLPLYPLDSSVRAVKLVGELAPG